MNVNDVRPDILIAAVDQTARAVLPPRAGPDFPGAIRQPEVLRLAERLYAVPGPTWREALDEWPATDFFTGAVAKRVLAAESPIVGEELMRGLVDPLSSESWIYRAAKDAAFASAFALGFAYGKKAVAREAN